MVKWQRIFKYNTIVSIVLFTVVVSILGLKTRGFNAWDNTVSDLIFFLNGGEKRLFILMFVIKASLDLGFSAAMFKYYPRIFSFVLKIVWLVPIVIFGILGFVTEAVDLRTHWSLAIVMFGLWSMNEIWFSVALGKGRVVAGMILESVIKLVLFLLIWKKLTMVNWVFEVGYLWLSLAWVAMVVVSTPDTKESLTKVKSYGKGKGRKRRN